MADSQPDTFETFIEKERSRLQKQRESLMEKQARLQEEVHALDKELAAIQAYDDTKRGKTTRAPSTGKRQRRGKRQEAVLAAIQQFPNGATRADLLEAMNAKGDKSAEQSVSNALTKMKKDGKLDNVEGRYVIVGGL